jgi:hypothetical protein
MAYSKGIMLYSDHARSDKSFLKIPKGIDFIVAVALDELTSEKGFTSHVQEAHNANIPLIAKVDIDIDIYAHAFSMANPIWPSIDNDPHMKILEPLFENTIVHAVMLDIRYDSAAAGWVSFAGEHVANMIKEKYNLPIYFLTDSNVLVKYPDENSNPQYFLSLQKMLCTHHAVPTVKTTDLILEPTGKPSPNWNGIKFWWFGSQKFDFITDTKSSFAPILQYRSTKEALYNELGFVPRTIVEEGEEDMPVEIPNEEENDDPTDVINVDIKYAIISISDSLKKIADYISRP